MAQLNTSTSLRKELGLFDVFAISTGAMFSSGFFLLPGLAAAKSGPAVMLAYLLAGILILPAMFSKAELSTALPRAGGTYYFLDRSLGPMVGTIGGLGTYLALSLKTAFALIGIGAYAAFFIELPIKTVAIALTVVFMVLNIFGAKETTALQRILVIILLSVLAFFVVQGLLFVTIEQPMATTKARLTPFMPFGVEGLLSTIGFVFVSYAGLTKVASVAEEVKNPDRNIPLGMMLSLGVTSFVYVVGVFIMVAVLDSAALQSDLTPVATAAAAFFHWLPDPLGLVLIVAAALAAFASTGNAGLLSASRYPLAMARDRLLPRRLAQLGRFRTPTPAILATGSLMIFFILVLDEEGIAKLASAFQLFIFLLVNLAVIVMRESRIRSYDPGYRSPWYPWMQIAGMLVSVVLIFYMGTIAILFTIGMVLLCLGWYYQYARPNVVRDGAIYHWFRRLGQRQYDGLDREFRGILKEKGLREDDPFNEVVARADIIDLRPEEDFSDLVHQAAGLLSGRLPVSMRDLEQGFLEGTKVGATPVSRGAALPHVRLKGITRSEVVLARAQHGLEIEMPEYEAEDDAEAGAPPAGSVQRCFAVFLLVSPEDQPQQHLRILAEIANRIDEDQFLERWQAASVAELKEIMLHDDRHVTLRVETYGPTATLVGQPLMNLDLPDHCLVAMIVRGNEMIIPKGKTVLQEKDRVTFIGDTAALAWIRKNLY